MELLPNLHWIEGRTSNFYLWTGDQGLMLVDAGMPGDALNTRGGRLQNSQKRATADPEAARKSALRLLRLNAALIACGHGKPTHTHDAADLMALQRQLQG
jgi:glyoxylase-like metal-dependent hydrolase (beta-lactamase superfamily II)